MQHDDDLDGAAPLPEESGERSARGRPPVLPLCERRRRLIEAVGTVFATRGFGGLTVAAIAAEAGMSRRTLYDIFGDRDSLLLDYIDDQIQLCTQPLTAQERDLPLRARLEVMFVERHREKTWELPLAILRLGISNAETAPQFGLRCMEIGALRLRRMVQEELERAMAEGEVPPLDSEAIAGVLLDMVHLPVVDALLDTRFRPCEEERAARVRRGLDIFFGGVAALGADAQAS